jgi:7-cyano-7-deazaguanine synthase in queuosine biosynthesis
VRLVCAPRTFQFPEIIDGRKVVLFDRTKEGTECCAGAPVLEEIRRLRIVPAARAWDFLSIALSVLVADLAGHRDKSEDGWTREFDLEIAVAEPGFWDEQAPVLEAALAFLTTDVWKLKFTAGGFQYVAAEDGEEVKPDEDCIVLLSGGLDSLIGAIDRAAEGARAVAVSQVVRGDAKHQVEFAKQIGDGLRHCQFNHNAEVVDGEEPPTQRARSMTFLAYGVLVATSLAKHASEIVPLHVCENGLIALNPPLTSARLGSLSTRTAHPRFLRTIQTVLDATGLRVRLSNPYQWMTKGEMFAACRDQDLVRRLASQTTSCGRFLRYGYKHCGRCIPCQVRRAAFIAARVADGTKYVYDALGRDDDDHRAFDDVRSAAMAIAEAKDMGVEEWLGASMSWATDEERSQVIAVADRGLREIGALHAKLSVT